MRDCKVNILALVAFILSFSTTYIALYRSQPVEMVVMFLMSVFSGAIAGTYYKER
jgi:hypothetical protein